MEISNRLKDFELELIRKGFRKNSVKNYICFCSLFLNYFKEKDSPKHISENDVKDYLRRFTEHNTQRSHHSAIKCFYKYIVKQPNKFRYIEYCKATRRLPIVHSVEEIQRIINVCDNKKHKAIICLMYACGLRIGEVLNLKITDIDSERMVINIIDAKGGIDRQVMLPKKLLLLLRDYYKIYRPITFLFNGQFSARYSRTSISMFLKSYSEKAKLNKRIHPHLIRHDCFTHLLESGCDIGLIQKIAGHKHIETTNLYLHTSHNFISKINSPINAITI